MYCKHNHYCHSYYFVVRIITGVKMCLSVTYTPSSPFPRPHPRPLRVDTAARPRSPATPPGWRHPPGGGSRPAREWRHGTGSLVASQSLSLPTRNLRFAGSILGDALGVRFDLRTLSRNPASAFSICGLNLALGGNANHLHDIHKENILVLIIIFFHITGIGTVIACRTISIIIIITIHHYYMIIHV